MTERPRFRRHADGTTSLITADGLVSLATRLGTDGDKAHSVSYESRVLTDHELEAGFRSSWAIKKAVKIPAFDAARKWRQWSGGKSEEIEKLEGSRRIRARRKVFECHWRARLYGGAAILIGLNDKNWEEPLEAGRVKTGDLRYLASLTRHDLASGQVITDPRSEWFGGPEHYTITTTTGEQLRVHASRLARFNGDAPPKWNAVTHGSAGWGESVLQSIFEACRNLDSTMANIAALVFDAKTDVVKIPNLTHNIVDPKFEAALLKRFQTARLLKGNHGTLILDGAEEYDSKAYAFGGLDKIADRFMQVAAGATDIPMTRFLGQSPGGLNATGDGDLTNYYDHIASLQTLEIQPELSILDEVLIRSAGGDPEDDGYEWRPLRQMTEKEISDIRNRDADTVSKLSAGRIYADEDIAELGNQLFQATGVDVLSADHRPEEDEDDLT